MEYFPSTPSKNVSFFLPGESGGDIVEVSYPHVVVHYEHRRWNGVQDRLIRSIVFKVHREHRLNSE
jgi:hypothetical protein